MSKALRNRNRKRRATAKLKRWRDITYDFDVWIAMSNDVQLIAQRFVKYIFYGL